MTTPDQLRVPAGVPAPQPGSPEAIRQAAAGLVWFLAMCARCEPDLAQPFRDEDERDVCAARHVTATGHVVRLTIDGLDELPQLHLAGVISRDQNRQFRYVCPADVCSVSNGPYASAELAIAAWRTHPVPVVTA